MRLRLSREELERLGAVPGQQNVVTQHGQQVLQIDANGLRVVYDHHQSARGNTSRRSRSSHGGYSPSPSLTLSARNSAGLSCGTRPRAAATTHLRSGLRPSLRAPLPRRLRLWDPAAAAQGYALYQFGKGRFVVRG